MNLKAALKATLAILGGIGVLALISYAYIVFLALVGLTGVGVVWWILYEEFK
jgi:hypothetical protein